ncbi:uroporphyrinogen-III C-methyltransferase [Alteraurantiacibacter palmitatis]|uniref:uroporphyrinogen-III C-methyltransferase n=1 Tax=Alteraurantiacibacter palmitatis TaxID=2054628 RepID=A0ABV7E6G5_9SPHN
MTLWQALDDRIEFLPGTVWLVGAGPGNPDLLTRKAERLICAASVVFHDALVGPGVLALVPPGARLVNVGKRSGRHSKDQRTINNLLVEAALAGERVIRLKGGDPSIFGRSMEEIVACRIAGIAVHICPGITAASAAAASLGTSLTLRGLARRVTFVTAYARAGQVPELDWQALADPQASLAIYMGKQAAGAVAKGLLAAGLAGDTPVAMVENASLATERLFRTRLDLLPIAARTVLGEGPALLLIGEVAGCGQVPGFAPGSAMATHSNTSPSSASSIADIF